MSDSVDVTIELARRLRRLADGLDEAELRTALSRSYYSVFHAARVLGKVWQSRKVTQGNVVEVLSSFEQGLGASVKELRDIRHKADYDENYVRREFDGDLELFRTEVRRRLDQGSLVFKKILFEIEKLQEVGES